ESVVKIIGNSGTQDPENAFNMLKEMLHDEKFSVKNAAMEMFVKLGMASENKEAINTVIELLDDNEKWTKMKALEVMIDLAKNKPKLVPMQKIKILIADNDSDIRGLVAKLLGAMTDFKNIFPFIRELMIDKEKGVRDKASNALVSISSKISMKELLPETLKYFSDNTDILLQQSMALALKRIVKYENEVTKKRVIDLLQIRCNISQDAIICGVLNDLKQ
ncbi:MAG: hypothetical protein GY870_00135, partial [archaeon]|nr:hypothetical protein [archaeon]